MILSRKELEVSIISARVEDFCKIINRALGDNLEELDTRAVLALSSAADGFNAKMKKKLIEDLKSANHLDLDLTSVIKRKFSELYVDKAVIKAVTQFLDKSGWGYNWVTYTEDPRDPLVIILALFRKDLTDGNV